MGKTDKIKIVIISDNHNFALSVNRIISGYFKDRMDPSGANISRFDNAKVCVNLLSPDVIIIDTDRAGYNCNDICRFIENLIPKYSVPIIACTSKNGVKYAFMNAGAMDVIIKPAENNEGRFEKFIIDAVKRAENNPKKSFVKNNKSDKIIVIGGSTGSTEVLRDILIALPKNMPPILATLHMPKGYTRIYAAQLNKITKFDVKEAADSEYVHAGQVIIAAGGKHLRVFSDKNKKGYFITSQAGEKVSGHCPSVNVLFESAALNVKQNAVGVILTGMGSDGAERMLDMKRAGSYNIGQNEKSSVVYGMPKKAYDIGAVDIQGDINTIVSELKKFAI